MSPSETLSVIEELRSRGVDVSRRGDGLRLRGPKDAVDPNLVGRVREHKDEILAWLEQIAWITDLSVSAFERQRNALELRVAWWDDTLWLVPTATDANALLHEGISAGRIWTVRELAEFLAAPVLTQDDIANVGRLKVALGAEIVSVGKDGNAHSPSRGATAVDDECESCGGHRFWRSTYGVTICASCHPPASPDLVTSWIDTGSR